MNSLTRTSTTLLASVALSVAALPAAASLKVTSVDGQATSGGDAVAQHGAVPDGETVETVDSGKCSLMLKDDAVLQLCNRAAVSSRPSEAGGSILDVSRGEMKATVGPQDPSAPLEIHTPAAVATILGTVVHVAVDPDTGDTLITSIDNRIRVTGVGGSDEAVVIDSGQQVLIKKGANPGTPRLLDRAAMADLSECLNDDDYRFAAIAAERAAWASSLLATVTAMDVPADSLPGVASTGAVASLFGMLGVATDDLSQDVCFASQSACDNRLNSSLPVEPNELNDLVGSGADNLGCSGAACNLGGSVDLPNPCAGVPGDQCQP